jgi:DNA-binding LytR/AlgR family response regulator
MNVLIVDDEPLAQEVLETYIDKIPDLRLVGKCSSAMEANETLAKKDVDLVFLDIQMPQITGIEFVRSLGDPPMIIFTTAYSDYALDGFDLGAVDYLLKPISFERFMKGVNKAREQYDLRKHEHSGSADTDEHFFVKADKKLVKVRFNDILYIEGLKDYVIIRLEEGRVITLQTMKSLEEKLPQGKFRRVHRSYIVSMNRIHAVVGNMLEVIEKGQTKHLPIGKNYRDDLLELINQSRI